MEILSWIVVGVVTGSFARAVMPGPPAGGMYVAMLVGVIGAFVGGLGGTIFLTNESAPFNFQALGWALNGSLYLLFAYRCIAMRTPRSHQIWRPSQELHRKVNIQHTGGLLERPVKTVGTMPAPSTI